MVGNKGFRLSAPSTIKTNRLSKSVVATSPLSACYISLLVHLYVLGQCQWNISVVAQSFQLTLLTTVRGTIQYFKVLISQNVRFIRVNVYILDGIAKLLNQGVLVYFGFHGV